ncbi:enzymatic polyprotein [Gregarina niphandrodes]|uniref:Enzymatic polyprotein n=1 Tax=Gregarina niphandrodes TaxID=110365 RepID=A0A023AWP2_GRENI|nr:enzymatic polyprotein [Gregarina niphandrodes]EZG42660.1 enzymatic polyprotein [Gregarina niphandrodes]|eukprot:XP_011134763.1 enzymatic polyprotein [Gregarina niphandrodes]
MVGYFRSFIQGFAEITGPLYELLQKDTTFKMTTERLNAFHQLQKALTECPTLTNPHPSWPYVLDTDASTTAIGACLMQMDDLHNLHPVRFGSRRLTAAERNWPIYELEGFAVVHFILAIRPYLIGRTFTVRSDHKPLQWLWKIDKPRLARWSMALQQFDFKIIYSPGTAQEQVDIFTRDVKFTKAD